MTSRSLLLVGIAFTLTACGAHSGMIEAPPPTVVAEAPDPDESMPPTTAEERRAEREARDAVTTTRALLDRASDGHVDTFAPGLFTLAEAQWNSARDALESGDHAAALVDDARARETLEEARSFAAPRLRRHALERFETSRIEQLMGRLLRLAVPLYAEDEVFVSLPRIFVPDSDMIRYSARDELQRLAKIVKAHPTFTVVLEARADDELGATRQLNLSTSRALAVRNALTDLGVPADRLRSRGRGEATPPLPGEPAHPARLDVRFQPRPVSLAGLDQ